MPICDSLTLADVAAETCPKTAGDVHPEVDGGHELNIAGEEATWLHAPLVSIFMRPSAYSPAQLTPSDRSRDLLAGLSANAAAGEQPTKIRPLHRDAADCSVRQNVHDAPAVGGAAHDVVENMAVAR
jgi:hypothetical protein